MAPSTPPNPEAPPPVSTELFALDEEAYDPDVDAVPAPFALFVLFEAALVPLSLFLGSWLGQHPLAAFAWDFEAVFMGGAAALPMLALLALIIRWPIGPFARIKAFFDRELSPTLSDCEWPDLAVLSTVAGVGEEMLFRGVIQGTLSRLLGPAWGVLLASLFFGLLHPISWTYVIVAGVLGAYLGVVWIATGNLLTVMVAHAVYDFVALALLLHERRRAEAADLG